MDTRVTGRGQVLSRNSIIEEPASAAIAGALLTYGPLTSDDIEFVTGRPHQTVSAVLVRMRNNGSVRNTGEFDFTRHGILAQRQAYVPIFLR